MKHNAGVRLRRRCSFMRFQVNDYDLLRNQPSIKKKELKKYIFFHVNLARSCKKYICFTSCLHPSPNTKITSQQFTTGALEPQLQSKNQI